MPSSLTHPSCKRPKAATMRDDRPRILSHPALPGWLLYALLLSLMAPAGAEIYKQVLPDGSIVYSDEPSPQAEVVELPTLQTIPAPPLPAPDTAARQNNKAADNIAAYRLLRITSPHNDQQIRENSGRVEIIVKVQPALQVKAEHRLVLKLDGQVVATTDSEQHFVLENVDRGTHQLVAEIQDRKGKPIKTSPPVTFHLFRYSRLQGPRPRN